MTAFNFTIDDLRLQRPDSLAGSGKGAAFGTILLPNGYAVHFVQEGAKPSEVALKDMRFTVLTLRNYETPELCASDIPDLSLEPEFNRLQYDYTVNGLDVDGLIKLINAAAGCERPTTETASMFKPFTNAQILAANTKEQGAPYAITQNGKIPLNPMNGRVIQEDNSTPGALPPPGDDPQP